MPADDQAYPVGRLQSERAARLMEMLGLSDDELCATLDVDALTLLSGQLDHRPELSILLALLDDAAEQASQSTLHRWVRATGPAGRPIDALTSRDIGAFEDAVEELRGGKAKAIGAIVGFVMRETKGRADGGEVNRLVRQKLEL